jgi:hypothetical protein
MGRPRTLIVVVAAGTNVTEDETLTLPYSVKTR